MDWLDELNEQMANLTKEEIKARMAAIMKARMIADLKARRIAQHMKGYVPINVEDFRGY